METKITVQFLIPGDKMYNEEECEEAKWPNAGFKHNFLPISTIDRHFKPKKGQNPKYVHETLRYNTRKCKPAVQVVNMSLDAYKAMLETPTETYSLGQWKQLGKEAKVKAHLNVMMHDLHAYSYDYYIAQD